MLASIIILLSSTLDYVACMMLDPQLYYYHYFLGQIAARTAVYAHVHILADHVTLSIG